MNTEKEWFSHPTRATELKSLLHDPTIIDALDVLTAIGLLPIKPPEGTTSSLMEFYALSNRWREGYLECLANIKLLASPKPIKLPDKPAWKSSPDKYKEAQETSTVKPEKIKFD